METLGVCGRAGAYCCITPTFSIELLVDRCQAVRHSAGALPNLDLSPYMSTTLVYSGMAEMLILA